MQPTRLTPDGGPAVSVPPYILWGIWLFWLFFLVQPLTAILQQAPSFGKAVELVAFTLFFAMYLRITWQAANRFARAMPVEENPGKQWWLPVGAMTILAAVLCLTQGSLALGSFIYVSASIAGRLTARQSVWVIGCLMALVLILGALAKATPGAIGQILFIVPAVALIVYFFSGAIRTNQELRLARREIARLAVAEERLRFARDLHDLLGHTLSLITLKSELAGQLIAEEPEQARREVRDIEAAARTALQEVREAVAGYRQTTLASELQRAEEILAAAGIASAVDNDSGALSPPTEALLAWAVREGVTNVIRHSRARRCAITITRQPGEVRLTITDDGRGSDRGTDAPPTGQPGNGLRGIAERVAALDGRYEAGSAGEKGFRLAVVLPLPPAQGRQAAQSAATKGAAL